MANSYSSVKTRLAWVNVINYRFPGARTITKAAGGRPELHRCKQQTWNLEESRTETCRMRDRDSCTNQSRLQLELEKPIKAGRREGCAAQGLIPGDNLNVLGCVTADRLFGASNTQTMAKGSSGVCPPTLHFPISESFRPPPPCVHGCGDRFEASELQSRCR
jgi:hypothetical protein